MPIFYLSFLKMPVKVIKKMEAIQRKFLWGVFGGERRFVGLFGGNFVNLEVKEGLV